METFSIFPDYKNITHFFKKINLKMTRDGENPLIQFGGWGWSQDQECLLCSLFSDSGNDNSNNNKIADSEQERSRLS